MVLVKRKMLIAGVFGVALILLEEKWLLIAGAVLALRGKA